MGKIIYIQLILGLLVLISCGSLHYQIPEPYKNKLSFCFTNEVLYDDSIINYNGYYTIIDSQDSCYSPQDYLLFYENGFVVRFFGGFRISSILGSPNVLLENIGRFNDTCIEDYSLWSFYNCGEWGQYRVFNDIITVQVLLRPDPGPRCRTIASCGM